MSRSLRYVSLGLLILGLLVVLPVAAQIGQCHGQREGMALPAQAFANRLAAKRQRGRDRRLAALVEKCPDDVGKAVRGGTQERRMNPRPLKRVEPMR